MKLVNVVSAEVAMQTVGMTPFQGYDVLRLQEPQANFVFRRLQPSFSTAPSIAQCTANPARPPPKPTAT